MRVLLIEDDRPIQELLRAYFEAKGHTVSAAADGVEGLKAFNAGLPELVLLDIGLPGLDGWTVLQAIRASSSVPVVLLTALDDTENIVKGLATGADDYLTKPFSPRELVLRVHSILRRVAESGGESGGRIFRAGPLVMDVTAHGVTLDGEDLDLTPTEFRLLQALLERRGRTQSRRQLLERAWDVESDVSGRIHTRTVDMHVRRLRTKLGPAGDRVETVRGFGYRFKAGEEGA